MTFRRAIAASAGFGLLLLAIAFPFVWFASDSTAPLAPGARGPRPVSASCVLIQTDGQLKAVFTPPPGTPVLATLRYTRILSFEPGFLEDIVHTTHEFNISPPDAVTQLMVLQPFVALYQTAPDWARDQKDIILDDLRAGRLTSTQSLPGTRARLALPLLSVIALAAAFVAFIFLRYVPPPPAFNAKSCAHCGYPRRGVMAPHCPECGEPHPSRHAF